MHVPKNWVINTDPLTFFMINAYYPRYVNGNKFAFNCIGIRSKLRSYVVFYIVVPEKPFVWLLCSYLLYSRKCWYPAAGEEFRFVPVCFFGSRKWLELMFFFKCVYLWKEVDSNLISLFFLNFFINFFIRSDPTFPSFSLSTFTEDDSTTVTLVNKTENGFI